MARALDQIKGPASIRNKIGRTGQAMSGQCYGEGTNEGGDPPMCEDGQRQTFHSRDAGACGRPTGNNT